MFSNVFQMSCSQNILFRTFIKYYKGKRGKRKKKKCKKKKIPTITNNSNKVSSANNTVI